MRCYCYAITVVASAVETTAAKRRRPAWLVLCRMSSWGWICIPRCFRLRNSLDIGLRDLQLRLYIRNAGYMLNQNFLCALLHYPAIIGI